MSQLQLNKFNYSKTRIVDQSLSESHLVDQQVLVKIDKFALTANNVTYAVVGEKIGYWQFFPPVEQIGDGVDEWGVLPVWGFADVVASKHPNIPLGERLFGYFPPASHFIMTPNKLSETSWVDASPHRSHLPAGYNMYRRVKHEPGYSPDAENDRMLLYPLHTTAFVLYDYFKDNDWFKAEQVIIISASSKTSTGLAYGIAADNDAPIQIGLTSAHNLEMVNNLNVYDETLSYEQVSQIDASKPTVIVDMSGNGVVLNTLHKHLGDNMLFCSNVGVTHWQESNMGPDFIRERSQMFFAPSQIQKRLNDWGPEGFDKKSREYMSMSIAKSREWLKTKEMIGLKGMAEIFPALCKGKVAADEGVIVSLD